MRNLIHRRSFLSAALAAMLLTLLATGPVQAQVTSLTDAKAQGLVGEQLDGYIGIVEDAPGVKRLVDDINLQRRQLYRDIARKNGAPLSAVEKLAGQKAIDRAASGEIVQSPNEGWVRKP